jgi:hypothetical protein
VNPEMDKIGERHVRTIARAAADFSRVRDTPVLWFRPGSIRLACSRALGESRA